MFHWSCRMRSGHTATFDCCRSSDFCLPANHWIWTLLWVNRQCSPDEISMYKMNNFIFSASVDSVALIHFLQRRTISVGLSWLAYAYTIFCPAIDPDVLYGILSASFCCFVSIRDTLLSWFCCQLGALIVGRHQYLWLDVRSWHQMRIVTSIDASYIFGLFITIKYKVIHIKLRFGFGQNWRDFPKRKSLQFACDTWEVCSFVDPASFSLLFHITYCWWMHELLLWFWMVKIAVNFFNISMCMVVFFTVFHLQRAVLLLLIAIGLTVWNKVKYFSSGSCTGCYL